jgi:hypothetical protein
MESTGGSYLLWLEDHCLYSRNTVYIQHWFATLATQLRPIAIAAFSCSTARVWLRGKRGFRVENKTSKRLHCALRLESLTWHWGSYFQKYIFSIVKWHTYMVTLSQTLRSRKRLGVYVRSYRAYVCVFEHRWLHYVLRKQKCGTFYRFFLNPLKIKKREI